MTDPSVQPAPDTLQFDRATQAGEPQADAGGVACSRCNAVITTYYYHLDGETVCSSCKQTAMQTGATQKSSGAFLRAGFFGFGAAVAGAAIYYGVIALANLEIGIIAILIGYMVGGAIRKGARGGGGRRYQVLAIALVYFSVGLAYAPLAFTDTLHRSSTLSERQMDSVAANPRVATSGAEAAAAKRRLVDSVATPASAVPDSSSRQPTAGGGMHLAIALGATFLMIFVLPILVVLGSMPSGLISALIIAIGMHQAWRMTQGHEVKVTGPYKVGGDATTAST